MQGFMTAVRGGLAQAGVIGAMFLIAGYVAVAQVPGPVPASQRSTAAASENFAVLVAPIALYPDELLAVVLQASMQPVQIVQAVRFLDKYAKDRSLQPPAGWIEPVRILVNYPEVLRKMNDDLDWTERLGEAMEAQQGEVLAAIQQFRRKVAMAGNLRSDDKLTVVQDGPMYVIESTNPQIINVPVYDPAVVVMPQPAPPEPVYVPTPYPAYYDPYPAGAAAATGFFFGALTTAWAMDWHHYNIDEEDIRDFQQSRQQSLSQRQQSRQDAASQRQQTRQGNQAQRQQGRQDAVQGRQPMQGGQGAQDLGSVLRGSDRPAQRPVQGGGLQPQRPAQYGGYQPQGGFDRGSVEHPGYDASGGARAQARPSGGDAFSYGSGRSAVQAGDRGLQSRSYSGGREFSGASRGGARAGGGGRGGRR